jgi:hypothetical protein
MTTPKFSLGRIVATPGALDVLKQSKESPAVFLDRHIGGDWGDVENDDKQANDQALMDGSRLLSAYRTSTGEETLDHHRS